ncbi:VPA1262 family protein [Hydrogenovibrio kuenenii]|uniref:VPA1262 family protein n=1 Tax=Hydrogenovibrio kuenenii TaxID=63658 RepID=UPI0004665DE0|nr:VPA1262 family protein [Hydrogenovibrio kuenenii]
MTVEEIINDKNLDQLFSKKDGTCAIQLWIAQIKIDNQIDSHILYGRVLPYNFSSNEWSAPLKDNFKPFDEIKAQVIRVSLYFESRFAKQFIELLSAGNDLKKISDTFGFQFSKGLEKRVGTASLGKNLILKPSSFLLNRDSHDRNTILSPHGSAGVVCAAISTLSKYELIKNLGLYSEKIISYFVERLNEETGLNFANEDAVRLGDVELLVFPTLDKNEIEQLDVSWRSNQNEMKVRLNNVQTLPSQKYIVQLKITNDHQVILSRVALVERDDEDFIECCFEVPSHLKNIVDSTEVEIYRLNSTDGVGQLCCFWKGGYIREFSSIIHVVGSANTDPAALGNWLSKIKNPKEDIKKRLDALQVINDRKNKHEVLVGGRKEDPWVEVNRKTKNLVSTLCPPRSDSEFFDKMSDSDGEGFVRLAEWFRELIQKYGSHYVLYFDPYFEDAGVGLIAQNASSKSKYIIFTTVPSLAKEVEHFTARSTKKSIFKLRTDESIKKLQSKRIRKCSKETKVKTTDSGWRRIGNLLASCKRLHQYFGAIDFKIYGMKASALHDRYIIVLDQNKLPVVGYNISNSIQKATENHPLLITPIPMDTLQKVVTYSQRLIKRALSQDEAIQELFDSEKTELEQKKVLSPLSFLDIAAAGNVLAIWTGNLSLQNLMGDSLRNQMLQLGLVEGMSLNLDKVSGLNAFIKKYDERQFNAQWNVVGEVLAYTTSAHVIDSSNDEGFLLLLDQYLRESISGVPDENSPNKIEIMDPRYFTQSLDEFFHRTDPNFQTHSVTRYTLVSWGEYFAINILWRHSPERLVNLVEESTSHLQNEVSSKNAKRVSVMGQIVAEISLSIGFRVFKGRHLKALAASTNSLMNWHCFLGLELVLHRFRDQSTAYVMKFLSQYSQDEKIKVLGWLLRRLPEQDEHQKTIQDTKQALFEILPQKMKQCDVELLVTSLLSHMRQIKWSEPWLFDEIIQPLLESGRVDYDDICDVWIRELVNDLNEKFSGGNVTFQKHLEGRVTQIASYLFAMSSIEAQTKHLKAFKQILDKSKRNILQPLASTTNWSKWNDSITVVIWIYAFTKWIDYFKGENVVHSSFTKLQEDAFSVIEFHLTDNLGILKYDLLAFIDESGCFRVKQDQ